MADDLAEVLADFAALPAYSRVLEVASEVVILQMQIFDTCKKSRNGQLQEAQAAEVAP